MKSVTIVRRLGVDPHTLPEGEKSMFLNGCPDIFELSDGNFAIIGKEATKELLSKLPEDAGVSPGEVIITIPRFILANAKPDIPDYPQ